MLGEVGRFFRALPTKRCSCGHPLEQCELWGAVWTEKNKWLRRNMLFGTRIVHGRFFKAVARHVPQANLLDTSKNPRRLEVLSREGLRPRVLFLQRDGVAVIRSLLEKRNLKPTHDNISHLMKKWAQEQSQIRTVLDTWRPEFLNLRFESLHSENAEAWKTLTAFVGVNDIRLDIPVDPAGQHQVDGNSIRKGDPFVFRPASLSDEQRSMVTQVVTREKAPQDFIDEMERAGYDY